MSRIFRTKLFIFAIVLSSLLVFPADAGTSKKKDDVTLSLNCQFVSEGSPKIEWRANYVITKKFFADRPWLHMKLMSSLPLPGGMNVQGADMTMSMVGDSAPDIFYIQAEDLSRSVSQGFLMPLDDYVKNWPEADARLKGAIRDMCSRVGPDGKKHIYALPFSVGSGCIIYNRKRFRDVGLTRGPKDWNELWEFGKKLYDADIDPETEMPKHWAIDLPLDGWFFDRMPDLAGGACWVQNPDGSWKSTIDSDACVHSLDMLKKMLWGEWTDKKGRPIKGVMNLSIILARQGGPNRAAMKIESRDLLEAGIQGMGINDFNNSFNERMYKDPDLFGIVQFPKFGGPGGKYANRIGGTLIVLNSQIKDKKVIDAAWEYTSYMCGGEGEREKTKIFIDNGVARYVNPALLKKYGYSQAIIDQVPKDWAEAYKTVFDNAYAEEDPPGISSIQMELEGATKQLGLNEHQDSRKALAKVQNMVARSYMYTPTLKEMTRNRKIALAAVIFLAVIMIISTMLILKTQVREQLAAEREKVYVRKVPRSKQILAWMLMGPAVLSVFLWQYIPLSWGSLMAFLNVHILGGIGASEWVGLDNFINVAMRPLFWHAWKITIVWVFMNLAMGFIAPILLALFLSEIPKGKVFFRTLYYLPALTTGVITALLWVQFYDPTQYGLVNRILLSFGNFVIENINHLLSFLHIHLAALLPMQPIGWLLDPKYAMAACILPGVWAGMGPGCIIYLAALKAVPEEQYDAADLDGAGIIQKTWHITLPTIFPLVLINFVGAFIGAFHSSGNLLIMTGGGPNHATHVMGLEMFYQGFVLANYGQTTAIAWMLGSILIGFTVLQMRIFARMKFSTAEQAE